MDFSNSPILSSIITLVVGLISSIVTFSVCKRNFKFKIEEKIFIHNINLLLKIKENNLNLTDSLCFPPFSRTEIEESNLNLTNSSIPKDALEDLKLKQELFFRLYHTSCRNKALTNKLIDIEIDSVHDLHKEIYEYCEVFLGRRTTENINTLKEKLETQISKTNDDIKKCIVEYKPNFYKYRNFVAKLISYNHFTTNKTKS